MMRGLTQTRWLLVLAVALALAVMAAPVHAEPESPAAVNVVVFGYVDVAGSTDASNPVRPACNLTYDTEDQEFARNNPLAVMTFTVRDPNGNELASGQTSALAELQRVRFNDVADHPTYTVELTSPPSGWALCPQEPSTRQITQDDITLGQARLNYYFYVPSGPVPTPVNTAVTPGPTVPPTPVTPTATLLPGVTPTVGPQPTAKPPAPTSEPSSGGDEGGGATDTGASAPSQPVSVPAMPVPSVARGESGVAYVNPPAGTGELAMIKGMAFLDLDCDGVFGAGDPGLNAVQVYAHGGYAHLSQITPGTGQFSFEALGDGEYDVFVNPGPEWTITTPWKYVVRVRGNIVTGIDFGLCRGEPAVEVPAAVPAPGAGIRLPDTGVMDVPPGRLLGGMALALTLVGLVGMTLERRRNRK